MRIRWRRAARAAAIGTAFLLAVIALPSLLEPPDPPPLAADVGLPRVFEAPAHRRESADALRRAAPRKRQPTGEGRRRADPNPPRDRRARRPGRGPLRAPRDRQPPPRSAPAAAPAPVAAPAPALAPAPPPVAPPPLAPPPPPGAAAEFGLP